MITRLLFPVRYAEFTEFGLSEYTRFLEARTAGVYPKEQQMLLLNALHEVVGQSSRVEIQVENSADISGPTLIEQRRVQLIINSIFGGNLSLHKTFADGLETTPERVADLILSLVLPLVKPGSTVTVAFWKSETEMAETTGEKSA